MKSPKRIVGLLVAGFLAFAPPGTMIFLSALFVRLVGWRWAALVGTLCVVAAAALLIRRRRQRRRGEREHPDTN
jgi:membrane protein implicated in regulation of membrane protease activity